MKKLTIILFASLISTGCVSLPPGTDFGMPTYSSLKSNHKVWLEQTKIDDNSNASFTTQTAGSTLTLNIQRFLAEKGSFKSVNTLPGKVEPSDHILEFRFTNHEVKRKPHPAYFPAAILTATIYIWVNGPIYKDVGDVQAELVVKDANLKPLKKFSAGTNFERNIGLYHKDYFAFSSGTQERTDVVDELVEKYLAFVNQ